MRDPTTQKHAKDLRQNLTKAETILWKYIKGNKIEGVKFRRQFPIEPFIVDYAAIEIKLIIEVDGATHTSADEISYDRSRETYLKAQGWRIIRVWNNEIYNNLFGVLEAISQEVYDLKHK